MKAMLQTPQLEVDIIEGNFFGVKCQEAQQAATYVKYVHCIG